MDKLKKSTTFSKTELRHIFVAVVALSFAFYFVLFRDIDITLGFFYSFIVVGIGFILHEMGHKFMARKYGCWAEFRMWPMGLVLALVTGLFGFVFAAPGAVMISPVKQARFGFTFENLSQEEEGKISVAGPVVNIVLALIFLMLASFSGINLFLIAAFINAFLAFFNMIPFGPLDGVKVLFWKPSVWVIVTGISLLLMLLLKMLLPKMLLLNIL